MKIIKDKKYIALIDIYENGDRDLLIKCGDIVRPVTVDKELVHLHGRPSIDYILFQDCFDYFFVFEELHKGEK